MTNREPSLSLIAIPSGRVITEEPLPSRSAANRKGRESTMMSEPVSVQSATVPSGQSSSSALLDISTTWWPNAGFW